MDTHNLFSGFDSTIRLNTSKVTWLKKSRKALRDKILKHFKDNVWGTPTFYSQGSFPLDTNLNPIKVETEDGEIKEPYDLDDGVYFTCSESDRKLPTTYHDRIKKAVDGHAESVVDKTTCVRVVFKDGHHIDLPSYWLEKEGETPQLAHTTKGFIESDPKAFKIWVDSKISTAASNGQLRRVIRYLKAWKNFRETKNSSLILPSGFILTILACSYFSRNDRDDLSLKETVESIEAALKASFSCFRPTVPTDEDLLPSYSKDTLLTRLSGLVKNAGKAIDAESEKEASEYWRNIF